MKILINAWRNVPRVWYRTTLSWNVLPAMNHARLVKIQLIRAWVVWVAHFWVEHNVCKFAQKASMELKGSANSALTIAQLAAVEPLAYPAPILWFFTLSNAWMPARPPIRLSATIANVFLVKQWCKGVQTVQIMGNATNVLVQKYTIMEIAFPNVLMECNWLTLNVLFRMLLRKPYKIRWEILRYFLSPLLFSAGSLSLLAACPNFRIEIPIWLVQFTL